MFLSYGTIHGMMAILRGKVIVRDSIASGWSGSQAVPEPARLGPRRRPPECFRDAARVVCGARRPTGSNPHRPRVWSRPARSSSIGGLRAMALPGRAGPHPFTCLRICIPIREGHQAVLRSHRAPASPSASFAPLLLTAQRPVTGGLDTRPHSPKPPALRRVDAAPRAWRGPTSL